MALIRITSGYTRYDKKCLFWSSLPSFKILSDSFRSPCILTILQQFSHCIFFPHLFFTCFMNEDLLINITLRLLYFISYAGMSIINDVYIFSDHCPLEILLTVMVQHATAFLRPFLSKVS